MSLIRSCLTVLNNRSGFHNASSVYTKALQPFLDGAGVVHHDVQLSSASAQEAVLRFLGDAEALVVCGGDGTVASIAQVLATASRPELLTRPLVLVPTGYQNTIAHSLGISSPQRAVSCLVIGRVEPLQLWEVTLNKSQRRFFCGSLAVGVYAQAVMRYHALHRTRERYMALPTLPFKFAVATLYSALRAELAPCSLRLTLRSSHRAAPAAPSAPAATPAAVTYDGPLRLLVASQLPYQHAGFALTPEATHQHGNLSVSVATEAATRSRLLHLFTREATEGLIHSEDGVQSHAEVVRLELQVHGGPLASRGKAGRTDQGMLMLVDGEPVYLPRGSCISVQRAPLSLPFLTV